MAVVGSVINGGVHFVGKLTVPRQLHPEDVKKMRAVYAPRGETLSRAVAAVRSAGAVILCAEPGNGRRITAVSVAADLDLTPRWLVIDEEDIRASLYCDERMAYLLDLRESDPEVLPALGRELTGYVAHLREAGSCLVVLATEEERGKLDLAVEPEIIKLVASDAREVFLAHLSRSYSREEALSWAADDRISGALVTASPQDAVQLTEHVCESGHRTPQQGVDDVLAAYHNWEQRLRKWFEDTEKDEQGYQRALLLAVATMENSSVAEVFAAADKLCETVAIPYFPGRGLLGPGISARLGAVDAKHTNGRVEFTRPRYGTAVLDHVWEDRPFFQPILTTWLKELRGDQPADILLRLATRHNQPHLVLDTVLDWSERDVERAVGMLTAAAMSDELGRATRSRMYEWARGNSESLQPVVAAVCGGPMADEFDQIALTRLRHLARRDSERVRGAVISALAQLVTRPRLRVRALAEVVRWARSTGRARHTGLRAFVELTALRSGEERLALMPNSIHERTLIDELASGWKVSLHASESADEAKKAAVSWLEQAALGNASREVVNRVMVATCQSSMDVAVLAPLIWRWARAAPEDGVDREGLCVELMRGIGQQDGLTPGISPLSTDDIEKVTLWES
ncbi:hypothetical protein [Streptosporangium saharense]|uniref:hypothetical protein n=1 Tax=Streptosporangium saharense TaxID=1706840 RepID=UPI00341DCE5D